MDKSRPKFLVKVIAGDKVVGGGIIKARNATQATNDAKAGIKPSVQITEVWVAEEKEPGVFAKSVRMFPWVDGPSSDRIKETTNYWLRLSVEVARRLRYSLPDRHRSDFASKAIGDALSKIETSQVDVPPAVKEHERFTRSKPAELAME